VGGSGKLAFHYNVVNKYDFLSVFNYFRENKNYKIKITSQILNVFQTGNVLKKGDVILINNLVSII
jgi:hypothetical protein